MYTNLTGEEVFGFSPEKENKMKIIKMQNKIGDILKGNNERRSNTPF
jgi:hypothetical protein